MQSERLVSLDIVRGFAIFVMIYGHITFVLPSSILNPLPDLSLIVAAPFFILVSGLAFELFIISRSKREKSRLQIFLESLSRSVALFSITLVPYVVASIMIPSIYPWVGILKWSVFQVIALGYVIGFFLQGREVLKIAAVALILLSTPFLNGTENLSFLTTGVFPLFPFLGFFITGQIFSNIYTDVRLVSMSNRNLLYTSILPLIFLIQILWFSNTTFCRDALEEANVFLLVSGAMFIAIVSFRILVDRAKHEGVFRSLERIGRISFSAYYLHMAIIFILAEIFTVLRFAPSNILIVSLLHLVILLSITWSLSSLEPMWRRHGYVFGVEWMFRMSSTQIVHSVGLAAKKARRSRRKR